MEIEILWDSTFVLRAGVADPNNLVEATQFYDKRISVRAKNGLTKNELMYSKPAFLNSKLRISTVGEIRKGMGEGWDVISTPTCNDELHASITSPIVPISVKDAIQLASLFGDPEPNPDKIRNILK